METKLQSAAEAIALSYIAEIENTGEPLERSIDLTNEETLKSIINELGRRGYHAVLETKEETFIDSGKSRQVGHLVLHVSESEAHESELPLAA